MVVTLYNFLKNINILLINIFFRVYTNVQIIKNIELNTRNIHTSLAIASCSW